MIEYLNNDALRTELQKSQATGRATDELGHMLMLMAKKIVQTRRFSGYSCRDDLVSAAVLKGVEVFHKYEASRTSNAFAWLSQVLSNAMRRHLLEENRQTDLAMQWGMAGRISWPADVRCME